VNNIISILILLILTVITGWGDTQFFIHSSQIWQKGRIIWPEIVKSTFGVSIAIVSYWLALKYLQEFKIISAEIQTILWFLIVIIGVAAVSGKFSTWPATEKIISLVIIVGLGWLLIKTGG